MRELINFYSNLFGFKANEDVLILKANEVEETVPCSKAGQIACLVAADSSYTGEMSLWYEEFNIGRMETEFYCLCRVQFENGKPISNWKSKGMGCNSLDRVNLGKEM